MTPSPISGAGEERSPFGAALASVLVLLAITWALHRLGQGSLSAPPMFVPDQLHRWVDQRDSVTVAFALLRLLGLAVALYLLTVTTLGCAARVLRSALLLRWVDLFTLPMARRLIGAVAGIGLSTSTAAVAVVPSVTSAATARSAGPPRVAMRLLPDGSAVTMRRLPEPSGSNGDEGDGGGDGIMHVADDLPPEATMHRDPVTPPGWTVQTGDHLWGIALHALTEAWGRTPHEEDVDHYWRALVAANRSRLVDPDNPDLIYPGQELTLPSTPPDLGAT